MSIINIKYCKKCKKAFDVKTDDYLCPKCRGIKLEEEGDEKT